jgi:hypothetical protein
MSANFNKSAWLRQVDEALLYNSWDRTWARMLQLINSVLVSHYAESKALEGALSPPADSLLKSARMSQVTGD